MWVCLYWTVAVSLRLALINIVQNDTSILHAIESPGPPDSTGPVQCTGYSACDSYGENPLPRTVNQIQMFFLQQNSNL